jgi:uncharacterized RDD family membrane protein YckC
MPGTTAFSGQPEEKGRRILAFLIDIIPALFLVVLNFIPFLDWLAALAASAYWLLRDFNGASPGKMVMGSLVVSANGAPSSTNQRILRNVPLAVPGLIALIPFVGIYIAAPISMIVFIGEVVMLLVTGRRVGDMLANTMVVRK